MNVMAGVPFAADRGRDNRPGASPSNGGLVCDAGKEPDPGPGANIPAMYYSTQYPAATLAKGQTVRWRWPAKNHANTPAAGTVEVYISNTANTGDTFAGQGTGSHVGQMSYSSDNGDCLGLATSTDTADCQGQWTVPTTLAEGRYTIMWWWEFNPGEFYNSCADVLITAAADTGGGGGGGGGGTGGGGTIAASPPPPRTIATTHVSIISDAAESDVTEAIKTTIGTTFAAIAMVEPTAIRVVTSTISYSSDYYREASIYTPLVNRLLIETAIEHDASPAGAVDADLAVSRLRSAMSTAPAAQAVLAAAGVTNLNVLEPPVVIKQEQSVGGGTSTGDGDDGGGNGGVIALVIILVLLVCGGTYYYMQGAGGSLKANGVKEIAGASVGLYEMNASASGGAPPPPPMPALPPGWLQARDPGSGRIYYINAASGVTTWTHPGAV